MESTAAKASLIWGFVTLSFHLCPWEDNYDQEHKQIEVEYWSFQEYCVCSRMFLGLSLLWRKIISNKNILTTLSVYQQLNLFVISKSILLSPFLGQPSPGTLVGSWSWAPVKEQFLKGMEERPRKEWGWHLLWRKVKASFQDEILLLGREVP